MVMLRSQRALSLTGHGTDGPGSPLTLRLLGEFELAQRARPVPVGLVGQRVLAFLALRRGPVRRDCLVRALWPDLPEHRLHACLRSVLYRLRKCCPGAVVASAREVRLAAQV